MASLPNEPAPRLPLHTSPPERVRINSAPVVPVPVNNQSEKGVRGQAAGIGISAARAFLVVDTALR